MREHSNSSTKQPLKDNNMTLIYSVYHGVNKQQPSSSLTTTTTTPIHNTHPSSLHHCHHQPLTTTWTCRYTIWMTWKCHISSRQVDGRWQQRHGRSMDIWWWQHHVQPQVSAHSPSPQSPSWPQNRCHIIYVATRWQTMTLFVIIFSDNKWPMTIMTDHNHNRWQLHHNNGRMTPHNKKTTPRHDDNATTTTHHPQMAPTVTSTQHHPLTNDTEGPAPLPTNSDEHPTWHPTQMAPMAMSAQHHTPPTATSAHHPPMTGPTMMTMWWHDNDNAMWQWHYVVYFSYL